MHDLGFGSFCIFDFLARTYPHNYSILFSKINSLLYTDKGCHPRLGAKPPKFNNEMVREHYRPNYDLALTNCWGQRTAAIGSLCSRLESLRCFIVTLIGLLRLG